MANDVFGKLKSSVNKGITTISVKTSSTLEKSKIKTHIDSLTKDIDRDYAFIGEEAFKIWSNGGQDFSLLNDRFEGIKAKQAEIVSLNNELVAIDERDNQILGNTTASTPATSVVQPITQPVAPAASQEVGTACVCPKCGAQYPTAVKFCRSCGTKIQE